MASVINARGVPLSFSTPSIRHFSATNAGPLLKGSETHDSMWGDSKFTVTMAGGAGDDIYHLYSAGNAAVEEAGAGIDTVKTWMSYQLPAHIENLTVTGSGRQAVGNDLDNIITGGDGPQTLDGGAGDDVLIGKSGADIYAVTAGNGSDRIIGFADDDTVRLTGYGLTSFDQVAARLSQRGDDAVLDLGNGEILAFADTAVGALAAEQFALQLDLSGMAQTFSDEFETLSLGEGGTWDSNFWWGAANGSTLNSQANWYIDTDYGPTQSLNPFRVDNGVLSITAQSVPATLQSAINGYEYASGLLNTYGTFSQTYGYFEMRADMPEGSGIWPAFWLLPEDGSWPPELDVIELAGLEPGRLIMTSHSEASGEHTIARYHAEVSEIAGFHTYGVLWGPETITWTYDGIVVAEGQTPEDMHEPMYMLVNLGLGGFTGQPGAALDDGVSMKVDYIRAYALGDPPGEPAFQPVPQELADDGDRVDDTAAADTLRGGDGADRFEFGALDRDGGDGHDTILDFERDADILSFRDLADANDDGSLRLDDLLASVASVTDKGPGGDVTVAFDNGASITFAGAGTGGIDSLTGLVNDVAAQIQLS